MLSEPKHYDYQDAAKKLSISVSQLAYYIKRGEIRAAVSTSGYPIKALLHPENLSEKNQQALMREADQHALIKEWDPIPSAVGTLAVPDYLYVNPFSEVIRYTDEPPHEFKSLLLETFDGQPVIPLDSNGWIVHVYLGAIDLNGLYSESVITAAEINVLSAEVLNCSVEQPAEKPHGNTPKLGYFEVTARSNSVAEAICHYGNLYLRDRKENPTADLLLRYMLEKSKADPFRPVTVDAKQDKPIKIVDTRLTERDFEKRLKRLLKVRGVDR
jgi:hypothetical protein